MNRTPIRARWRGAARLLVLALMLLPMMLAARDARADGLEALKSLQPVMQCADLAGRDFSGATDAAVTISSAAVVTGSGAPYCSVTGVIAPANRFAMRLPTQGWTQRYLQTGCGGLCGQLSINPPMATGCLPVTDGTIAESSTDMGHEGANDGSWAANNPQALIDFAYRSQHVTAQVAKAIVTAFYGRKPAFNYFDGCSDGGREALMEAQRYPDDFDGIAAGAPANDFVVQNSFHHGWNIDTNLDANGKPILLAAKLPLIHQAAVAACDTLDGVADGIIGDPRRCHFDPRTLICAQNQDASTCLSAAEAGVVQRLHDGAVDKHGLHLETPLAHEWGSELDWTLFIPSAPGVVTLGESIVLATMRYINYFNVANPDYQVTDLKFTVPSFIGLVPTAIYLDAVDPDLSAFRARGGKLLLWHGWSDQHITPQSTLQYYKRVQETLGERAAKDFVRLFFFPGVAHCGSGLGPNVFDVLSPVMAWRETGTVPTRIIAARQDSTGAVTTTRPVYPYPAVPVYTGHGSTSDASNFVSATLPEPAQNFDWLGTALYTHGYQAKCTANGTKLICRPGTAYDNRSAIADAAATLTLTP